MKDSQENFRLKANLSIFKYGAKEYLMSDETQENQTVPEQQQPLTIHGQYIRDISFESPNAPLSMFESESVPDLDIKIDMDAREIKSDKIKNLYETVLEVHASAKRGEEVIFIAEIQYAIAVSFTKEVPQEDIHPILLIEMPTLLFPYMRELLGSMTVRGGFPPLLLNQVDFQAMYMQRFGPEIEKARQKLQEGLKAEKAEPELENKEADTDAKVKT